MVNNFDQISLLLHQSTIGKHLPQNLYVHISTLDFLDKSIQEYELKARKTINNISTFTLIKFSLSEPKISYLFYPEFLTNPHPPLAKSIVVNLKDLTTKNIEYSQSNNPPILHRKETF